MADLWDPPENMDEWALPGDEQRASTPAEPAAPAEPEVPTPAEAPEPTPATEEAEPSGRQRDDKGRFVKAEEAESEPEPEPTPAEKLYAGKYRSADELERAYAELQSLQGRTGQELGDLRQQVDALRAEHERARQPQYDWDTLIDEQPHVAAQLAYQQGNQYALQQAAAAWEEVSPGAPAIWWQNVQMRQRIDQLAQGVQAQTAPLQQEQSTREWARAINQFEQELTSRNLPGLDELAAAMGQAAGEMPVLASLLGQENVPIDQKLQALKTIYHEARDRNTDTLAQAARTIARETAAETQRAKEEGIVLSATATVNNEKPSLEDRIAAEWDEYDRPYREGWNIS